MSDAASFDAVAQCNLLEIFCEALGAAIIVTDKHDEVCFASVRLLHMFPLREDAIEAGTRMRDLYRALYDAGCRLGLNTEAPDHRNREDWVSERVAVAWKERTDAVERNGANRWFRIVSRRFASGLGLIVIQDVSEHKKREEHWRLEQERVRVTEDILDSLPIAVAIKDKNLKFAAVNRQFCAMFDVNAEDTIGKGLSDVFAVDLATSLEARERSLLADGEDTLDSMRVHRDGAGSTDMLLRARRIGKPGQHYLAMIYDEMPTAPTAARQTPPDADIEFAIDRPSLQAPASEPGSSTSPAKTPSTGNRRRVVYAASGCVAEQDTVAEAAAAGIELCVVRNRCELAALLPALRAAGIDVDLIAIAPGDCDLEAGCRDLAALHDVQCNMVSHGCAVSAEVLKLLSPTESAGGEENRSSVVAAKVAQSDKQADPAKEKDPDILAIEDNPVNRLALEQMLESLGLSFIVVKSGAEAIERLESLSPRVIFADLTLPDLGIAQIFPALSEALARNNIKAPVIALTTPASCKDVRKARSAGFADALQKPLSPEMINSILKQHLLGARDNPERHSKNAA